MRFVQYGNPGSKTVIFLHGGGLSTWNFRDEAEILQGRFHVLIPILDGHHGSDHKFASIEENAARIIRYIDSRFQGQVFLIAGLSLGGQVLVEMLSQRNNICEFAMIESTLALPTKTTAMLVRPVFSLCYPLVKKRWYAKLQCEALHIRDSLFEDYFRDSSQIKKGDMIAFLTANAAYTVKDSLPLLRQDTSPGRWKGTGNLEKIRKTAERDNPGVSAGGDARLLPWGPKPESSRRIFPQTAGLDL